MICRRMQPKRAFLCNDVVKESPCQIGLLLTISGLQPHMCDICGKNYAGSQVLTRHIDRVHKGESSMSSFNHAPLPKHSSEIFTRESNSL